MLRTGGFYHQLEQDSSDTILFTGDPESLYNVLNDNLYSSSAKIFNQLECFYDA